MQHANDYTHSTFPYIPGRVFLHVLHLALHTATCNNLSLIFPGYTCLYLIMCIMYLDYLNHLHLLRMLSIRLPAM